MPSFSMSRSSTVSLFFPAEDEADGFFLGWRAFMAVEPREVEFHLAFVGGFEFSEFEFDGDHAAQVAMIEKKIEVVILVIDGHALLAGNEGESGSEFEDEAFDFPQDGGFEIAFRIGGPSGRENRECRDCGKPGQESSGLRHGVS
jgi:hypothetical protein